MSGPHDTQAIMDKIDAGIRDGLAKAKSTTAVLKGDRPVAVMMAPDLWYLESDHGKNIIQLTAKQRAELREVLDNDSNPSM